MKRSLIYIAILISMAGSLAQAQESQTQIPVQQLAEEHGCIACHVDKMDLIDENGRVFHAPNIVGKRVFSIYLDLKRFKSGSKHGSVMNGVAASLTDQEIRELANYISKYSLFKQYE